MYAPASFETSLLLTVFSAVCWGSWVNTFKGTHGYRFELFYWDFAIGIVVWSAVIALTFGSNGTGGEPFVANLAGASTSNRLYALIGGLIFNAGNLLLVAGIQIAGIAVAFPIAAGIAIIEGVVLSYLLQPKGNIYLLGFGVLMAVIAVLFNARAYSSLNRQRAESSTPYTSLGVKVSVISGVLLGGFAPFITQAMTSDHALTPYTAAMLFALGALLCCFAINIYFMRRPLQGEPVSFGAFWRAGFRNHLFGFGGGAVWAVGTCSNFVAAGFIGVPISYAIGQSAPLIAAGWGVCVWHEFRDAKGDAWRSLTLMTFFFIIAVFFIALAYSN